MRLCGSPQRNGPSEARWQVSGLGAECKSCLSGGPPAPRDKDGEGNHRLFEFQVCKPITGKLTALEPPSLSHSNASPLRKRQNSHAQTKGWQQRR